MIVLPGLPGGEQLVRPFAHEYDELRLRIYPGTAGSYRVLATTHQAEAAGCFEHPFSELQIENFILRMSRPRGRRRIEISAVGEAKRFGAELFKALFRDQVLGLFRDSLAAADHALP